MQLAVCIFSDEPQDKNVFEKTIEFPEEYYQAGIGILNYFSEYVKKEYPDEDVKVTIEQDGLQMHLKITTINGDMETLTKALDKYKQVMSKEISPEEASLNPITVLGLKQQLAISEVIIKTQANEIEFYKVNNDKLYQVINASLSNIQPVTVNANIHQFQQNTQQQMNLQKVEQLKDGINDVLNLLNPDSTYAKTLKTISNDLKDEDVSDPEKAKKSKGLKKLSEFLADAQKSTSSIKGIIENINGGKEALDKLVITAAPFLASISALVSA